MRHPCLVSVALLLGLAAPPIMAQRLFDVPLRINMGGSETIDSFGRIWLGDGPGPGDPLNIRPDDASGTHTEENWLIQNFQPDSLDNLGFDSTHPGDMYIFNTIRWDEGAIPPDYLLEIPIKEGVYTVNMYFNEACCTNRHFKILIQDDVVDEDVSYLDYDPANPALGRVGVLPFPDIAVGPDNILHISLLPCLDPECPGGADPNAIVDAIEVISNPICDHLGLDFNCNFDPATGVVTGTWNGLLGADSYRILRNGVAFGADLPGGTRTFSDPSPIQPNDEYQLIPLDGATPLGTGCRCYVNVDVKNCTKILQCQVDDAAGEVAISWVRGGGFNITALELRRNGELIATLPPATASYEDSPPSRVNEYTLTTVSDPAGQCPDPLTCSAILPSKPFDIPLRINMGGRSVVDSKGRTWLGDGPGAGDPLEIRVDDGSGTNWIEGWCPVNATSMRKVGFDPLNANDNYIMSSIRWDLGNDGIDFRMEFPVPNAPDYLINLYFNECCCPARHFRVEIQDEVMAEDVSYLNYDKVPGTGKAGVLTFRNIAVTDGILRIALIPCPDPDCPGSGDTNAIINAIEILTNPCVDPTFRICPENLSCTFIGLGRKVIGNWDAPLCINPVKYELLKNGEFLRDMPGDSISFNDNLGPTERVAEYEVRPIMPDDIAPCPGMTCVAQNTAVPFAIPLRLNMGGRFLKDSRGQLWIGDGAGPGDQLEIRPDDTGGTNTIESWCVSASRAQADSLRSLGLDALNANDQGIYNTIRFDDAATPGDFRLELPVPNGNYLVNLYLTECCCANRHFIVEINGIVVDEDVSSADYSTLPDLGRTGRLSFDQNQVTDGILRIGFLPCPDCPFDPFPVIDNNAIIDAIEVLPAGTVVQTCPRDLATAVDVNGTTVQGSWLGPENVTVSGYQIFRDGVQIGVLPAGASSFTDPNAPCQRMTIYEVAVLSDAADFLCPGLRLRSYLYRPECPFAAPVRINMGGSTAIDSHGDLWLGDGPGPGDPLEIRPDDSGGDNWIENWTTGILQPDSLIALGFDPDDPGDSYIFNTIRWDDAGRPADFLMEIPIANGTYTVNMYFNEQCCVARHFKIDLEGTIVDDDVSYLDYDPANPALGRAGRLTFPDIVVEDEVLNIGLLPCPECPGALDRNAIIDALEILSGGGPPKKLFHRGDADDNGQLQLTDAIRVLGYLFIGQAAPPCFDAADADDNGALQLTDAIRILGYLFLGAPPPAPPGPPDQGACGSDPGDNSLGCDSYTSC